MMRPFYFGVVLWGEEFRSAFLNYGLPSLLALGNIPALENRAGSRFLICTTAGDWAAMQNYPAFKALGRLVEPVFLEIPRPATGANTSPVMSGGHKLVAAHAFAEKACGVFLTPDLMLSDGSVAALQRLVSKGNMAVLCGAMQFVNKECLAQIDALRGSDPGGPLTLGPRALAGIALHDMQGGASYHDWDAPFSEESLVGCFWRVPGGNGIVLHNFNWVPLLINYAALAEYRSETFGQQAIDGDYIFRNFSLDDRVHVVRDSDEIFLASLSGGDEFHGQLVPKSLQAPWYSRWPGIRYYWKLHCLRSTKNSSTLGPLKRRVFALSVRWHRSGVDSPIWAKTEARAAALVAKVFTDPSLLENVCAGLVRLVQQDDFSPSGRVEALAVFARAVNSEYANQSDVGSYRIWLVGPPVSTGRWYWEVFSPNLGARGGSVGETATIGVAAPQHSVVEALGSSRHGWGWRGDGHAVHAGRMAPCGRGMSGDGQVILVALDMNAGKIWFGLNGQWFEAGDPAAGTHPAFQGLNRNVFPAVSSKHGGQGTAALFTHVTPDSWTYEPPEGFRPLTDVNRLSVNEGRIAP